MKFASSALLLLFFTHLLTVSSEDGHAECVVKDQKGEFNDAYPLSYPMVYGEQLDNFLERVNSARHSLVTAYGKGAWNAREQSFIAAGHVERPTEERDTLSSYWMGKHTQLHLYTAEEVPWMKYVVCTSKDKRGEYAYSQAYRVSDWEDLDKFLSRVSAIRRSAEKKWNEREDRFVAAGTSLPLTYGNLLPSDHIPVKGQHLYLFQQRDVPWVNEITYIGRDVQGKYTHTDVHTWASGDTLGDFLEQVNAERYRSAVRAGFGRVWDAKRQSFVAAGTSPTPTEQKDLLPRKSKKGDHKQLYLYTSKDVPWAKVVICTSRDEHGEYTYSQAYRLEESDTVEQLLDRVTMQRWNAGGCVAEDLAKNEFVAAGTTPTPRSERDLLERYSRLGTHKHIYLYRREDLPSEEPGTIPSVTPDGDRKEKTPRRGLKKILSAPSTGIWWLGRMAGKKSAPGAGGSASLAPNSP